MSTVAVPWCRIGSLVVVQETEKAIRAPLFDDLTRFSHLDSIGITSTIHHVVITKHSIILSSRQGNA
jgi:hypothetical protein